MTFVGKILVIIILAFSLFFLALSAVVFTTQANWRAKTEAQAKTITESNRKLNEAQATAATAQKDLEDAKRLMTDKTAQLSKRVDDLTTDNSKIQKEITENRTLLESAQLNASKSLAEADARTRETEELRAIVRSTGDQANAFKEQQRELNTRILILDRELKAAVEANKSLRDRTRKLAGLLQQNNINPDVERAESLQAPPEVEGKVTRVDARNKRVEISIGSDDGIVVGHVLSVFRTKPNSDYLGRIKIMSVDPDQAVGEVIESDKGKKIQEGDNVATKIRPRS